jgi:hypothetical protein
MILMSRGFVDAIRSQFGTARPVLVLTGAGGVGKSALLGRFLLEHARKASEQRLLFAYLPFDDPSLRAEEPLTLVVEIVSQIERQFPDIKGRTAQARAVIEDYRERLEGFGRRGFHGAGSKALADSHQSESEELYEAIGRLLLRTLPRKHSLPNAGVTN